MWDLSSHLPNRTELEPPAVEAQILNHWTTKEVPIYILLYVYIYIFGYIDCFFSPQMVGCPVLYTPPASYFYFLSSISWPPDLVLKPALHPEPHLSHSIWCLSVGQEGFPSGTSIKNLPARARDPGSIPGLGRSLEEGRATHPSILAWRIPWTEEPGRLQSMRSQRVGHDLVTKQ